MKVLWTVVVVVLAFGTMSAQRSAPPDSAELNAITERGRMLYEYDIASWHSTDSVIELKPNPESFTGYVARKIEGKWRLAFGRVSDDKKTYLIAYEAAQQSSPEDFRVTFYEKPMEDKAEYLTAAKAFETEHRRLSPVPGRLYRGERRGRVRGSARGRTRAVERDARWPGPGNSGRSAPSAALDGRIGRCG
jgi:hypothetical protein